MCAARLSRNPDNIETALPAAAKKFADEGLSIPLVTTPGNFTTPDIDYAERFYAACGAAGAAGFLIGPPFGTFGLPCSARIRAYTLVVSISCVARSRWGPFQQAMPWLIASQSELPSFFTQR